MHGWSDNTGDDVFTHTVRLEDDARAIELRAVCRLAPGIRDPRDARVAVLAGDVAADALDGITRLGGTRMVGGFGRRLGELVGQGAGRGTADRRGDRGGAARAPGREDSRGDHRRDRARRCARRAGRSISAVGRISRARASRTARPAGRCSRVARSSRPCRRRSTVPRPAPSACSYAGSSRASYAPATRLHLFSSMHDDVHGFDLHYEIDLAKRHDRRRRLDDVAPAVSRPLRRAAVPRARDDRPAGGRAATQAQPNPARRRARLRAIVRSHRRRSEAADGKEASS